MVIVDCTELFIENPHDMKAKKQLWSEYKHHQTMKFLIGLGPHMGLTYVSRMFGGCASDKHITMQSTDLIDNLRYVCGKFMCSLNPSILGDINMCNYIR